MCAKTALRRHKLALLKSVKALPNGMTYRANKYHIPESTTWEALYRPKRTRSMSSAVLTEEELHAIIQLVLRSAVSAQLFHNRSPTDEIVLFHASVRPVVDRLSIARKSAIEHNEVYGTEMLLVLMQDSKFSFILRVRGLGRFCRFVTLVAPLIYCRRNLGREPFLRSYLCCTSTIGKQNPM